MKIPAIEKLLDYTASGVGAIAGPMLAPWTASREAKSRLAAARIDAETRRIEAESEAETAAIIAKARAEAREYLVASDAEIRGTVEIKREDIIQRIEFQESKRHGNVSSVVRDTADDLGDKEVDDHEPDPDWTARFFDCVQDVSSEDMQKLWAKILAGEVESPGRTSLRTLDTLKNMTKRDAELFKDICNCAIKGCFIFHNPEGVDPYSPLPHYKLLKLQNNGLIHLTPLSAHVMTWGNKKGATFGYQDDLLLITRNQNAKDKLSIPGIYLTTAGTELYQVAQCTPQIDTCNLCQPS